MKSVVFIGAPGSGKGTQLDLLKNACLAGGSLFVSGKFEFLAASKLISSKLKEDPEMKSWVDQGNFVDDETVNGLVQEAVSKFSVDTVVVFDGYPRTLNQASFLRGLMQPALAVYLDMSMSDLVSRIEARFVCASCGAVMSLSESDRRIYEDIKCVSCGKLALLKRKDDSADVFPVRWKKYSDELHALLDFYHRSVVCVDANNNKKDVFEVISVAVRLFI